MAVFEWRGINPTGKTVKGVRDADSPKALKLALRREGVLVTEILEESEARIKKAREVDFARLRLLLADGKPWGPELIEAIQPGGDA